ncbi:CHASE domain-containing protein [Dasania sp. GY-MA-18]|uniref:histidine kinase n=1 Tax=Dasania phycosphaerae TaxID=2950436 RepID=A0A9J6RM48_9GAMM|nr:MULTISPECIES: CHASE domain-containing protein [Dasania]MCR8922962.1 CHASE domain-containing protein [Dasania sp. GY-MA-18]MCZ0865393.1 CHASE domain-containing protein [Dasania phycosphaerae]MCZ0869118.1 CHASE domain-containing protein [Dasania phycosphaerae]
MKPLLHFFLPLVGYFLMGHFGLLLSIPPGFASAVWPASGLALACVLLLNPLAATLGIGLGSFLVNYSVVTQGYSEFSVNSAALPMLISVGAMLQAQAGYYLFRRSNDLSMSLSSPTDIYKFTFLVAPISCLISPSVGVAALYTSNTVAAENVIFNWGTWWVGDTIGVLLFTPLILTIFIKQQVSSERKLQVAMPALIIFAGVLILFLNSVEARKAYLYKIISDDARDFLQKVEERLSISEYKLMAYTAFHQGSESVSMQEFFAFTQALLSGNSSFTGIGWTEIVPADKRQHYENAMRAQGFSEYNFTEIDEQGQIHIAPQRSVYYPVLYIFPIAKNIKAFGLNLAAIPNRLAALQQAREQAISIATPPIRLAQEQENQRSIILYTPIFDTPATYDGELMQQKPQNFVGYVSGVFRISDLLGPLIHKANQLNYDMAIIDISNSNKPLALLESQQPPLQQFPPILHSFDFGGRQYQLSFYATNSYQFSSKDWLSWSILTIGLLTTAILQAFILIITGITERVRREVNSKTADLQLAMQAAEAASHAKSNFVANMNHELRTPLNAIIGIINLCLKTPLSDKQLDYMQKAKRASGTLLSLINQTLDYSKIDAGKMELAQEEFNFIDVLLTINATFSLQVNSKGIEFDIKIPEYFPARLVGDQLRLEQILLNLCSNALKFTNKGKIEISINILKQNDSNIEIEIVVTDTGIGINPNQLENLFDSFQQADTSTTRIYGGTGLGLTITKQLIDLMKGGIRVESTPQQGSRFYVQLSFPYIAKAGELYRENVVAMFDREPLQGLNVDPEINNQPHYEAEIASESDTPLENTSILLVEDVKMNQFVATSLLEDWGAFVAIAENGLKAVEMLKEKPYFNIILMDIQMPIMDGFEATKKIKEDPKLKHIPIVAMTANVMSSDIERCHAAGMSDHVGKPIAEQELLEKVLKNKL